MRMIVKTIRCSPSAAGIGPHDGQAEDQDDRRDQGEQADAEHHHADCRDPLVRTLRRVDPRRPADVQRAHLLAEQRGVTGRIEFEMLQGMATEQSEAVSTDVGQLLLYVPAVRPTEFDVAVSYLVRRLEENSASANFMSGIFDLAPDNRIFKREESRFRAALEDLEPDPEPL